MRQSLKGIRVKGKNGVSQTVFEREHTVVVPILGHSRKMVRFELGSGEPVDVVDANTFILTSTGEKLLRVRPVRKARG